MLNIESSGNLESTADIGCANSSQLNSNLTPPDLYKGLMACTKLGAYQDAAFLYALAGTYSYFDAQRVEDESARQAHSVLTFNTSQTVGERDWNKLLDELQKTLGEDKNRTAVCSEIKKIGKPNYYPRYMVQHGIKAFTGLNGDGLVQNFDEKTAWKKSLDGYLLCSDKVKTLSKSNRPRLRRGYLELIEPANYFRGDLLEVAREMYDNDFDGFKASLKKVESINTLFKLYEHSDRTKINLLMYAVLLHDVSMTNYLLEHGADPDIESSLFIGSIYYSRVSPIAEAAGSSIYPDTALELVRTLLVHGANANGKQNSKTALHNATKWHYIDIAKLLLEAGADPNAQDDFLTTPIQSCATGMIATREKCAKILLEAGADPTI